MNTSVKNIKSILSPFLKWILPIHLKFLRFVVQSNKSSLERLPQKLSLFGLSPVYALLKCLKMKLSIAKYCFFPKCTLQSLISLQPSSFSSLISKNMSISPRTSLAAFAFDSLFRTERTCIIRAVISSRLPYNKLKHSIMSSTNFKVHYYHAFTSFIPYLILKLLSKWKNVWFMIKGFQFIAQLHARTW